MTEEIDGLDILYQRLAIRRMGWHRHEHSTSGETAYFPSVKVHPSGSTEQRKLEDAWEQRALAMHAGQEMILPEAKPLENVLAERTKIARGD